MQPMCRAYQEVGQYTLFPSGEALRKLLAQRKADSAAQQRAPAKQRAGMGGLGPGEAPLGKVAEAPAPYKTQPFTSTNRYFRGRVVDALRTLGPGERLGLLELGPQVKADFSPDDLAWLYRLTSELARDGLIALHAAPEAANDEALLAPAALTVSLP